MKFKELSELLSEQKSLFDKKSKLQDQIFAISALQDGKHSALLYRLGENVQKKDFSVIIKGEEALNSLCKIFAVSHPYSAIGLAETTIYISLSQSTPINIGEIIKITSKLVNSDLSSHSCIPIVADFYNVLDQVGNQYVRKILAIKQIQFSKIKYPDCNLFTYAARDEYIFKKFFKDTDIQNIQLLINRKDITFEQLIPAQDELHMHVELNLVTQIIEKHTVKSIDIGLASSKVDDEVGLCGYCVATIDSVSKVHSINITRSADFPQNIPMGHWDFPYKLLNTGEKNYLFFQNLLNQYKPIVEKSKGNPEAYKLLEIKLSEFEKYFEEIYSINRSLEKVDKGIDEILGQLSITTSDDSTQTEVFISGNETILSEFPQ